MFWRTSKTYIVHKHAYDSEHETDFVIGWANERRKNIRSFYYYVIFKIMRNKIFRRSWQWEINEWVNQRHNTSTFLIRDSERWIWHLTTQKHSAPSIPPFYKTTHYEIRNLFDYIERRNEEIVRWTPRRLAFSWISRIAHLLRKDLENGTQSSAYTCVASVCMWVCVCEETDRSFPLSKLWRFKYIHSTAFGHVGGRCVLETSERPLL